MGFYTMKDYENILFDTIKIKLPANVLSVISELSAVFVETSNSNQSVNGNSKSDFNSGSGTNYNRNHSRKMPNHYKKDSGNNSGESWEKMRAFKATKIEKSEGGINDIRIALNKISKTNYTVQKDLILTHILELKTQNTESFDEIIHRVGMNIFTIVSTNHFYSELYATLYKELITEYSIFYDILNGFIEKYTDTVKQITYVDPNVDYDRHCEYNKSNDSRKSFTLFIVNLMKNGVLEKPRILHLIDELQRILFSYVDMPGRINEVEEIVENVFLFITKSYKTQEHAEWKDILSNVETFSKFKLKEKTSISSRALFKTMDILDAITKAK
jgi:hypothetical protein